MAVSRQLSFSNGDVLVASCDSGQGNGTAEIQVATTEKIGEAVCNVSLCTTPLTDISLSGNTYYSGNLTISPWLGNSIIVAIWCEFVPAPMSGSVIIGGIYPLAYFNINSSGIVSLHGLRVAEDGTNETRQVPLTFDAITPGEKHLLLAIYDSTNYNFKLFVDTTNKSTRVFTEATAPAHNTSAVLYVGSNVGNTEAIPIKYYKVDTFWYAGSPTNAQVAAYYNGGNVPWVKGGLYSPSGVRESDFLWIRDTGSNIGTNLKLNAGTGIIKLGGEVTEKLYVYRQCISPNIATTTDTLNIPYTGASQSLTVTVPSTMSWRVRSVSDPFTAPTTLQQGTQTISIGATENSETTSKGGVLNLCSEKINGVRLGSWASTIANASYSVTLTGTNVLTRIQDYSFSMEFWFTFNQYYTSGTITLPICNLSNYISVYYYYNATTQIKYIGLYNQATSTFISTTPIESDKKWHAVISVDRLTNTIKGYIDGVLVGTQSNTTISVNEISSLIVGNTTNQLGIAAYGVRVFSCVLTQEDVTRLYFNGHPFLEEVRYILPITLEYKFTEESLDYTSGYICENSASTGTTYNLTPTNVTDANIYWGATAVVSLIQAAHPMEISTYPTRIVFPGNWETGSEPSPQAITIFTSGTSWSYEVHWSYSPSLYVNVGSSGVPGLLNVNVTGVNPTTSYRTGTIVFTAEDGVATTTLRLYQQNNNNDPIPDD